MDNYARQVLAGRGWPDGNPARLRPAKFSIKIKVELLKESGSRCVYCRCFLTVNDMTVDHIVPKSKGGTNDISNLAACCYECNQRKADLSSSEFKRSLHVKDDTNAAEPEVATEARLRMRRDGALE